LFNHYHIQNRRAVSSLPHFETDIHDVIIHTTPGQPVTHATVTSSQCHTPADIHADNPNVTAILAAHYPGEEVGNSIVDVLWGAVNPSGKLPYTIAYNQGDYKFADITNSTALLETENPNAWQSDFEERLLIDYRKPSSSPGKERQSMLTVHRTFRLLQRIRAV